MGKKHRLEVLVWYAGCKSSLLLLVKLREQIRSPKYANGESMMISEVNLYSVPESQSEVCIHVAIENKQGIETHLFSADNTYYVDNFIQWLGENISQSETDLEIIINGQNNTMYSIYFELLRTYPKVSLANFKLKT